MNYQEITVIISMLSFGFLGGFSHCSGMCGPFVLTQVSNRLNKISIEQITVFKKLSGLALLPYHFGRITTYCFIAFLSSFLTKNLKNIVGFRQLAGVLLIIGALIIFNSTIVKIKLPFKLRLRLSRTAQSDHKNELSQKRICNIPKKLFSLQTKFKILINSLFFNPTGFKNYFLGIMLGFIPCGLVYGAIVTALSLGNHWLVLLAMLAFGIGTVPALFLTACGGNWLLSGFLSGNNKFIKIFTKTILLANITTLLVMAFGLIFNKI